jgi:hypothetical protein
MQKHGFGRWTILACSLDDLKLHQSVTQIIILRPGLRVDDDADSAQLFAKFNRDRERGPHKTLPDALSLGVLADGQPGQPENR